MKRDYTKFPDDENGDVLWQMLEDGDNLSKPGEIDFSVIFPTEEAALRFASVSSCSPGQARRALTSVQVIGNFLRSLLWIDPEEALRTGSGSTDPDSSDAVKH
jgi:hypothetical protein